MGCFKCGKKLSPMETQANRNLVKGKLVNADNPVCYSYWYEDPSVDSKPKEPNNEK
jgi:hypothetical protein